MACPLLGLDRVLSWTGSEFKFLIGYLGRSCAQPDLEPRWAAVLGFCFWLADHHRGHSHHGISAVSSLFHSTFSLLLTTYLVHQATLITLFPPSPSPQPAPFSLNGCPSLFFTCLLSIFTSPRVFCHLPLSPTICSDDDSDADDGGSDSSAGGNDKGEKTSGSVCCCVCLVNAYGVLGMVWNPVI